MLTLIYGRVSTDRQELSTQEQRCKEYAQFQRLGDVVELYDDDTSGSIPIWNRPQGRRLREMVLAGLDKERLQPKPPVRHVIVAKLDRLGRNAEDLLAAFRWLRDHGVTLHIVDMGGDSLSTNGPYGKLMFTILAAMAEMERDMIRARIQDRLSVKRDRGEVTGTVPYGFNAEPTGEFTAKGVPIRRLVDHPAEQQVILRMHTLRQAGQSYHAIARELNLLGIPTKQGQGKLVTFRGQQRFSSGKWQCGNVAKVLNSKTTQDWLARHAAEAAA